MDSFNQVTRGSAVAKRTHMLTLLDTAEHEITSDQCPRSIATYAYSVLDQAFFCSVDVGLPCSMQFLLLLRWLGMEQPSIEGFCMDIECRSFATGVLVFNCREQEGQRKKHSKSGRLVASKKVAE